MSKDDNMDWLAPVLGFVGLLGATLFFSSSKDNNSNSNNILPPPPPSQTKPSGCGCQANKT